MEPREIKVTGTEMELMIQEAVIRVSPLLNSAVNALQVEVARLASYTASRVVACDADAVVATDDLATIRTLKRTIEAQRTEYTRPINAHLDDINAAFKTLSGPLNVADKTTEGKLLAYRAEQRRKAGEAKRINDLRIEAARAEQALKGEVTEPVELVAEPPPPPQTVHTDTGTSSTVKNRKWRLIDASKVPEEYKILNEVLIGKVVRSGVPSILGIEIYFEENLRITR